MPAAFRITAFRSIIASTLRNTLSTSTRSQTILVNRPMSSSVSIPLGNEAVMNIYLTEGNSITICDSRDRKGDS